MTREVRNPTYYTHGVGRSVFALQAVRGSSSLPFLCSFRSEPIPLLLLVAWPHPSFSCDNIGTTRESNTSQKSEMFLPIAMSRGVVTASRVQMRTLYKPSSCCLQRVFGSPHSLCLPMLSPHYSGTQDIQRGRWALTSHAFQLSRGNLPLGSLNTK